MKVVFLEDVFGIAQGGDVKEVRNGFARNYLIPKKLAVPAMHNALQRVKRLGEQADATRLRTLSDMKALATELDGIQVNVEMRAAASGRLYGSVTSAIVTEELSKLIGRTIDRKAVDVPEPIRELGAFDLGVHLHPEVEAKIKVLVYATGTEPTVEAEPGESEAGETEAPAAEDGVAETEGDTDEAQ